MEAFDSRSEAMRSNANGEKHSLAIPISLGEQFYGVLSVARDEGMSDDDIKALPAFVGLQSFSIAV